MSVVAAEVGRLAHFGNAVGQSLAALASENGDEMFAVFLERMGHLAQHPRPGKAAGTIPIGLRGARACDRALDLVSCGVGGGAELFTRRGSVDIVVVRAAQAFAADE